jgi:hypothetical protein
MGDLFCMRKVLSALGHNFIPIRIHPLDDNDMLHDARCPNFCRADRCHRRQPSLYKLAPSSNAKADIAIVASFGIPLVMSLAPNLQACCRSMPRAPAVQVLIAEASLRDISLRWKRPTRTVRFNLTTHILCIQIAKVYRNQRR